MMSDKLYITKKGLERIKKERQDLFEIRGRRSRGRGAEAAYAAGVSAIYEDPEALDRRIKECEHIIKNSTLIEPPEGEKRKVVLVGATVTLTEEPGGKINEYTLVGSIEANPMAGLISFESPVGRELL